MSDPRATRQSRRLNGTFARTAAETTAANTVARDEAGVPTWTILGAWLAAVAAVVMILGLVFGYGGGDTERPSGEPAAAGSATAGSPATASPSAPLSMPQPGERSPAQATPADDDP